MEVKRMEVATPLGKFELTTELAEINRVAELPDFVLTYVVNATAKLENVWLYAKEDVPPGIDIERAAAITMATLTDHGRELIGAASEPPFDNATLRAPGGHWETHAKELAQFARERQHPNENNVSAQFDRTGKLIQGNIALSNDLRLHFQNMSAFILAGVDDHSIAIMIERVGDADGAGNHLRGAFCHPTFHGAKLHERFTTNGLTDLVESLMLHPFFDIAYKDKIRGARVWNTQGQINRLFDNN